MKFLEARRIVNGFAGGSPLPFRLCTSGTADPLLLYIQAAAAERGLAAEVRTLPFGTLGQALLTPSAGEREVFVLFPWDLCPELDWRSGTPAAVLDTTTLLENARDVLGRVRLRPDAALLYAPAPLPPVSGNALLMHALDHELTAAALAAGAVVLDGAFSLESYCRSGCPFATDAFGSTARAVIAAASPPPFVPAKVLVTDFDNVMWAGVVGEDGATGVRQEPDAHGYAHFIYQSYLRTLKSAGIVIAGVTRNDEDLALAPLRTGASVLREDDFVAIIASYNAKSAQIAELARTLNLGLDSFLFVDDNPIELAEVRAALPQVRALQFPATVSGLPALFADIARACHRDEVTAEDTARTELYRRRLAATIPMDSDGADLTAFLADLRMRLAIHDRSAGDRTRAVQLINKTNQFNLNGVRRSDEEVAQIIAAGGRLFTATLEDRHGAHGEILACLVDAGGVVRSFVLSCRVFQRRVEHAFMAWLAEHGAWPAALEYRATDRNEPMRRFLAGPGFSPQDDGCVTADRGAFLAASGVSLTLFQLEASAGSAAL